MKSFRALQQCCSIQPECFCEQQRPVNDVKSFSLHRDMVSASDDTFKTQKFNYPKSKMESLTSLAYDASSFPKPNDVKCTNYLKKRLIHVHPMEMYL